MLPTLLVVLLTPALAWLGFWQLDRADEKRALLDAFERGSGEPLPFEDALARWPEGSLYGTVVIEGRYDGERQILLDGQVEGGRAGYDVLTPFVPAGDDRTILVNRGFVPLGPNREPLADVAVSGEERRITGRLAPLPRAGLDLGSTSAETQGPWPRVMLYPDHAEVESALGRTVLEPIIWLDPDAPDGFVRAWRVTDVAPARHVAYALQWFAFAATLVVIYVVLLWRRRRPSGSPGAQP
jgi:surfeit locus 1 family protein